MKTKVKTKRAWMGNIVNKLSAYFKGSSTDGKRAFRKLYNVISAVVCLCILTMLLLTVSWLPPFGDPDNPANNEIIRKYLEDGVQDTGAVNIVVSIILDYRAFDTFGEACVLFVAACAILTLLQDDGQTNASRVSLRETQPPRHEEVLRTTSLLLVPIIMIFGCYVILNGHLTPGGGFSGGAILGSALILFTGVYGIKHASRFINMRVYHRVVSICLIFYALAKGYSFYTGANGIDSIIPLGTPGRLFSAGLIMPLNIAIGLIVACTVYMIYVMFSKGEVY